MGGTVFLFVNVTKIYHFKGKDSETKNILCVQEINGCVYDFSVDYRAFDTSNITNIHKYLMKKHSVKKWVNLKNVYQLSTVLFNGPIHTKCVSLSN